MLCLDCSPSCRLFGFLGRNLGRVFGCLCRKLGLGLGKFGHFRSFLGQAGGLESGGFRGAVCRGLGAGRCIGRGGCGIVTCGSGLVSSLGNAVSSGQGLMRNLGHAERHGLLQHFTGSALRHADLGGGAIDHIVEIIAVHDRAGDIHTGLVECACGAADRAGQHGKLELAVEIINAGDERLALRLDFLKDVCLLGLLLFDGQRGLELGLVCDDSLIFVLQVVEFVNTELGLGDLPVHIFFGADHIDDTLP